MKYALTILLLAMFSLSASAQTDKEERDEKKAASKLKVESNVFRQQMLTLKEYSDERRKLPEMQKSTKERIKLVAFVDSANDADDTKNLVGFIRVLVADNATDIYEVTYDRALKKIIFVKPTGETVEIDKETGKKTTAKKAPSKKSGDDDEDTDDDDTPASKKKKKQKDPDDDN